MVRIQPAFFLILTLSSLASAQMPDVSKMSGVPLPTNDLPVGTVSVRVVRGSLSNNITNHPVELRGGVEKRAVTDAQGRAQFTNLPPGTIVRATTTIDGTRLESESFSVPASGGVRLMLVARAAGQSPGAGASVATPAGSSAPQPGTVIFGGQTRFIVELSDEALDVYYLLDVANPETHAVTTTAIEIAPPEGARSPTVLEGSSPQAKIENARLIIRGPFQPGITPVQFGFQLPYRFGSVSFAQKMPIALSQTSLAVRKVGAMHVESPQAGNHRETLAGGQTYILAAGDGLPAGAVLDVNITGLPHHSAWPKYVALGLAAIIATAGTWLARGRPQAHVVSARASLKARREQLLDELVRFDERTAEGRGDAEARRATRAALVGQLELVYAELDNAGAVLDASQATRSRAPQARVSA
jgi:hypothetical protein